MRRGNLINSQCIKALTELSDNNEVTVVQNKHIKIVGLYGGVRKVFTLSTTPDTRHYERAVRSRFRRFADSVKGRSKELYNYQFVKGSYA